MNVLSLFDGMSCGQIALEKANIPVDNYYASEIDRFAIKVTQDNYPNTIQLGDVKSIKGSGLPKIDLVIGGSPCQGFSYSGKQLNFEDDRSRLFFEFVRILDEVHKINPEAHFLLENVKMKHDYRDIISDYLLVAPYSINSKVVSAQSRPRLYWTSLPKPKFKDKNITLKSILLDSFDSELLITEKHKNRIETSTDVAKSFTAIDPEKALCMTARQFANWKGTYVSTKKGIRKLDPVECERLQTIPDGYTGCVSNRQRYKMLGNGWTVDVIAEFFKNLK